MESIWTIVVGLFFFAVLIAFSYYLNKKVKAGNFGKRKSTYIESLDRLALSNDKWLEIITLNSRVFLLGITPNGITIIKEFKEDEFDFKKEVPSSSSFSGFFGTYFNMLKKEKVKKEDI